MFDQEIMDLVHDTGILNQPDKNYLLDILPRLAPLEKFKLRTALNSEQTKAILSSVQLLKVKYPPEVKKPNGIMGQISNFIHPPKPQKLVAMSILSQPAVIGTVMPMPITSSQIPVLNSVDSFTDLLQLNIINQTHLQIGSTDQEELSLQRLLNKLDDLINKIEDINIKRSFFASYIQSPLFVSYLNTGLTAMRHPEIEPRDVILNTLHKVNENYLNNKTFEMASIVTNHLRHLCGI
jgi:hypothetical protein